MDVGGEERYAQVSHGLFPRFVAISAAIAAFGLFSAEMLPGWSFFLQGLYFPFVAFALFYMTSRVRLALDRDYARAWLSVFLGSLVALIAVYALVQVYDLVVFPQSWSYAFADALSGAGGIMLTSVQYSFVGFLALLLSYYRRM